MLISNTQNLHIAGMVNFLETTNLNGCNGLALNSATYSIVFGVTNARRLVKISVAIWP